MLSRPADGHAGVSRWTGLRPDSTIQVACDCFREKEEEEEEREEEEEGEEGKREKPEPLLAIYFGFLVVGVSLVAAIIGSQRVV